VGPKKDAVSLDLTHLDPKVIDDKLPDITDFARTYQQVEPKTAPVMIQPTAHYAMGGIPTNIDGEVIVDELNTVMRGLYAAGECACVSVHGANRLGTNSLLDIVVFGRRGGAAMAEFVQKAAMPDLPKGVEDETRGLIERMKVGSGGENVADIRTQLQDEMMDKASVFRTDESLRSMRQTLAELKGRYEKVSIQDKGEKYNYDLTEAIELGFLIDLAETLVEGALARTESRGAHFRDDHPTRDDANWMKHTLAYRTESGGVRLAHKPVAGGKYEPMERKY
ncbi:MAG TPA: FAD-binding protein, partial [Candidatus Limnocylindrales bacterium]|nr:FAD-binding protein [Candidatus Limnocylindrales bacterium]